DNYESYGNAIGDFDNNGFSDIAVLNAHGDSVSLWKNSGGSNKWVKVKLIGTVSNKEAIGSILEVWRGSSKYVRYYGCGASYLSQNSSNIILGLGSSISIDSLFVRWPSGIINVFRNISSNQTVTLVEDGVIGIHNNNNNLPSEYKLFQNYPNPFNPSTVISYQLVVNSFVNLKVYDLLGSEVATLVNEQLKAGSYKVEWNGANYPGGAYFYRLIANDFTETKKMILIK
ncbi:MAG: ASPIC/UnbV domain-containing protein, partial [Ignavibacteria bacterium]